MDPSSLAPALLADGTEGAAGRYALQKKKNLGYVPGDGISPLAWIITKNEKNVKEKKKEKTFFCTAVSQLTRRVVCLKSFLAN